MEGGGAAFEVTAEEACLRQQHGALVVDVRGAVEWAAGHAPDALHIPLAQLPARVSELPREREVLLLCESGSRGWAAAAALRHIGFERAFHVRGGMAAWGGAGLPIVR